MHSGEEFFQITWQGYVLLGLFIAAVVLLAVTRRLPPMSSFKDFADVVNSAGGNIILLALFTAWSVKIAMQFFYHVLALPVDHLTKADAIVTAGIAFVTGTLVGTFAGALIKTLTGGKANGTAASGPDALRVDFTPEK